MRRSEHVILDHSVYSVICSSQLKAIYWVFFSNNSYFKCNSALYIFLIGSSFHHLFTGFVGLALGLDPGTVKIQELTLRTTGTRSGSCVAIRCNPLAWPMTVVWDAFFLRCFSL